MSHKAYFKCVFRVRRHGQKFPADPVITGSVICLTPQTRLRHIFVWLSLCPEMLTSSVRKPRRLTNSAFTQVLPYNSTYGTRPFFCVFCFNVGDAILTDGKVLESCKHPSISERQWRIPRSMMRLFLFFARTELNAATFYEGTNEGI